MEKGKQIPTTELSLTSETGADSDALKKPVQDLPRELTTPSTATGERYGRLPTHFQHPEDKTGRVSWIVEPGTTEIDISPVQEGTIIERGIEFLLAKRDLDEAEERIEELKPLLKIELEKIPGVAGIYYEKLGLGLTNIEQNPTTIINEAALREKLGSEFYELAEQEVSFALTLAKEILDRTGKPVTPEYLIQLFRLALEISLKDPDIADSIVSTKTKTTVDKKVAVTLWDAGKIGKGDLKFRTTHALTPDSKPRTAPKAKNEDNQSGPS